MDSIENYKNRWQKQQNKDRSLWNFCTIRRFYRHVAVRDWFAFKLIFFLIRQIFFKKKPIRVIGLMMLLRNIRRDPMRWKKFVHSNQFLFSISSAIVLYYFTLTDALIFDLVYYQLRTKIQIQQLMIININSIC